MSKRINLSEVRKRFSLPMQALVAVIMLLQLFVVFIILYLRRDFKFEIDSVTSISGWIMLCVTIFFCLWNIVALIKRNRQLKKATTVEEKEQIFKSTLLVRYVTMVVVSIVALVFVLVWKDIYFFIYFVFSIIWQVVMFPSKALIAMAIGSDEENNITQETPSEEVQETTPQTELPQQENPTV